MSPRGHVNFGIIGTGNIAAGGHGRAFLTTRLAKLRSVCSRSQESGDVFAKQYGATKVFTSIDKMLEDPDLDAVLITSPDKLHFVHAMAVARSKKHILLEKPMVTNEADGNELVTFCKDHNIRLAIAYHLRHHTGHRVMVEKVRRGEIGKIIHVRLHWSWRSSDASNWRASPELGQWWSLAGVGTHCLDLARWVLSSSAGEISNINALASNSLYNGPHDEVALLTLKFSNGASAAICSASIFDSPTRFEVYGTDGFIIAEDTLGRHGKGRIRSHKSELEFTPKDPFAEQLEHFSHAIMSGSPVAVDGEEGLKNVQLLLQATTCPGYLTDRR
jgi:predicted dehydrogenase